jgi:cytoskeletal protein RodZ
VIPDKKKTQNCPFLKQAEEKSLKKKLGQRKERLIPFVWSIFFFFHVSHI